MLQLAIDAEFTGKTKRRSPGSAASPPTFPSRTWPRRPREPSAGWIRSARRWRLKGKTLDGRTFDTGRRDGQARADPLLAATWCEPCKQDMETIKSLLAKYGSQGFYPVGINLDNDAKDASAFLRTKTLAWPQLYETGGLDSRLATRVRASSRCPR